MSAPTVARAAPVLLACGDDRGEWLAARRNGIGASEIAAVLGISPWESPFSLYWRKRNGWEIEANDEMSAGTRLEPAVALWWADQHPGYVVHGAGLYAHPLRPWQIVTPDRLVCDPQMHDNPFPDDPTYPYSHADAFTLAVLECKWVAYSWDGWGRPGSDEIPVHYRAQALWQVDVMGVDDWYLAALGPDGFRDYHGRRDETDLRVMREAGARFMARLAGDDPPDVDEHTATITTLKRLHPSVDHDGVVEVDADLAAGYARARALKARAAGLCDRYEARLRAALGPARRAMCGGRLVASRSVFDRAGYTVAAATIDRLNPGRSKP